MSGGQAVSDEDDEDDESMRYYDLRDWYGMRQSSYSYDPRWDGGAEEGEEDTYSQEYSDNGSIQETSEDLVHPNFDEGDYLSDQVLEEIGMVELQLVLEREVFSPEGESSTSNTERARLQQAIIEALTGIPAPSLAVSGRISGNEQQEAEEGEVDEVRATAGRRREEAHEEWRRRNPSFGEFGGDSESSER
jgi:hypothetical protein